MYFSIIVPVYKIEETYLRKCIESLMAQDMEEYEVILVDDGSPDKCGKICDEYVKLCNKIRVVHTINKGVSAARNIGVSQAIGRYVIFVDGDDKIYENVLGKMRNILERSDADISIFMYQKSSDIKKIYDQDITIHKVEDAEKEELKRNIIAQKENIQNVCIGSPWGKVFKRDFLNKYAIKYVEGIVKAQDRVFMLSCLNNNCTVQTIRYFMYIYNNNNMQSICRKYNSDIKTILLNTGKEIEKLVADKEHEYEYEIGSMYVAFLREILILDIFHSDNKEGIRKRRSKIIEISKEEKFSKVINNFKVYAKESRMSMIFWLIKKKLYFLATLFGIIYFKGKSLKKKCSG
ncbi:MAG: glycosyltransferase family 2 protein [Lachnospiraceae bacterium]|nr:glycosyltransferase family 2 protein [Lachnospiraceae bacterium]